MYSCVAYLDINRKASTAESWNSKSQSRTSSKVSKSKVESPEVTITEEEEQAYAEWEAMDELDRQRIVIRNNSPEIEDEDEETRHYK